MNKTLMTVDSLSKRFDDLEAVCDVSFSMNEGEIFSLLGPNGAGKTTTLSMLSCLITPTSGTATIAGHDILTESLAVRSIIGVVPQEIALYDDLTANQNLRFWGSLYDLSGRELSARIDEVLEQVGLTDRAGDRIKTYSGGMKRRINIAAGLLHRPRLLFMDEPTVGIDPQSRRRILDMILELREQGISILYTTHYMEEAEELSDRVGIIDHGQLVALGTQSELTQLIGGQDTVRLHLADYAEGSVLVAEPPELSGNGSMLSLYREVPGVVNASRNDGEIVVNVDDAGAVLPALLSRTDAAGLRIRSVDIEEPNLEAVFLHLTGRALRD